MAEAKSLGFNSRLAWGDHDLQLQTELRREPTRIHTMVMSSGEILGSAERDWPELGDDLLLEQRRVNKYHDKLLLGLERLRDEKGAGVGDMAKIFDRLVDTALRLTRSLAADLLETMTGARWIAVVDAEGNLVDEAPDEGAEDAWRRVAHEFRATAEDVAALFTGGQVSDVNLKTDSAFLLVAPLGSATLIAKVEIDSASEALQILRSKLTGSAQS